jgi:hypothetical protein
MGVEVQGTRLSLPRAPEHAHDFYLLSPAIMKDPPKNIHAWKVVAGLQTDPLPGKLRRDPSESDEVISLASRFTNFCSLFSVIAVTFGSAAPCAASDDATQTSSEFGIFAGKGAKILGSSDVRAGGGLSYAFAKPEPKFRIGRTRAQLVWQGYVDYTDSIGVIRPRDPSYAAGGIAYARWWGKPFSRGPQFYSELGEGLQYATRPSYDLPSEINSTPILGFGVALPLIGRDWLVGVRLLHASNAGFVSPNRGQDEIFLTVAVSL